MNLRSKRLAKALDPAAARFLDSTPEDAALVADDILGSLAHVQTLAAAKIVTPAEAQRLGQALTQMHAQATSGSFPLLADLEDVHMNVEAQLTQRLGDLGKKVHTARSRNDQVALDLRLWARRHTIGLARETLGLSDALLQLADEHGGAILPGHTHFQIAQPILFSHWLGAHAERLARDLERLLDAYKRLNVCPLGAGALAGTNHAANPALTARLLGFDAPFNNSLDAVSDRDFAIELLGAASLLLTHASSLAEEVILYTHPAFGFFEIGDDWATGSSLMPQKKNPDVLEVLRARAGTVLGALTASHLQLRALPLAYNRDLQEQKRLFLTTFPTATECVETLAHFVGALTVHAERMENMAAQGYSDATDVADYLVQKGVPFRDAHEQAAQIVRQAVEKGVPLSKLPLPAFQRVSPKIGKDLLARLGPSASVAAKQSPGSTGPASARAAQRNLQKRIGHLRRAFDGLDQARQKAELQLLRLSQEVKHK